MDTNGYIDLRTRFAHLTLWELFIRATIASLMLVSVSILEIYFIGSNKWLFIFATIAGVLINATKSNRALHHCHNGRRNNVIFAIAVLIFVLVFQIFLGANGFVLRWWWAIALVLHTLVVLIIVFVVMFLFGLERHPEG